MPNRQDFKPVVQTSIKWNLCTLPRQRYNLYNLISLEITLYLSMGVGKNH